MKKIKKVANLADRKDAMALLSALFPDKPKGLKDEAENIDTEGMGGALCASEIFEPSPDIKALLLQE